MPFTSGQPIVLQTIDEKIIELQQRVNQISAELILINERIDTLFDTKVSKSGDTMTGPLIQQSRTIDINVVPSSTQWDDQYQLKDKNGAEIGAIYAIKTTADLLGMQMEVSRTINGSRINNNVRLYISNDGTQSVTVSNASAWRTALSVLPLSGGTLTGGLTISSGGLTVSAGGANITGTTLGRISHFSSRQTTPNVPVDGVVGLSHFLSTSSMDNSGLKPANTDGHIIHMSWDNTGGWDSQFYQSNGQQAYLRFRGQSRGTWGSWYKVYTEVEKPSASDVGLGNVTNNKQMPIAGGTFTGNAVAYSTNRATNGGCLRNIEVRITGTSGTLQSTNKIIMVRK